MKNAFQEAGLSPNEARVYEALIELGQAPIELVSSNSKVHRRNVYDSISKLLDKGLVSESFVEDKRVYMAVNPSRLMDIIAEKESQIKTILPELERKFSEIETVEEAYIYRGIRKYTDYFNDIIEVGETVYFIGAKGAWLDPRLERLVANFQKERKRNKIKLKLLFDSGVKTKVPLALKIWGEYKLIPKKYDSTTTVVIYGDRVVTYICELGNVGKKPVLFFVRSKQLAEGYRKFFEFMWDHCPKHLATD